MTPTDPELVTRLRAERYDSIEELFALKRDAADALEAANQVLQAVLDAIAGTLDPHTQIADHPNVKFAQMRRLDLEEAIEAAEARVQQLEAALTNVTILAPEDFDRYVKVCEQLRTSEGRAEALEAALTLLIETCEDPYRTQDDLDLRLAKVKPVVGRADTQEPS